MKTDLSSAVLRLKKAGVENPERVSAELAAHVLGCGPLEVYFQELTPRQRADLDRLICRAEKGEPAQYIIGHVNFRGLEIRCDRRALIPRPETEQLVEKIIEFARTLTDGGAKTLRIADIGTGTGCIGLALLSELPCADVTAVDFSCDALALAEENAGRLGLSDRFHLLQGHLLEPLTGVTDSGQKKLPEYHIMAANLPYIRTETCLSLNASVRDYEPLSALDGGPDGLDIIRELAGAAPRVLTPEGGLFLEIGYDQGPAAAGILRQAGFREVEIYKDLSGLDRIAVGRRGPGG